MTVDAEEPRPRSFTPQQLGFTPRGLSDRAGLALALHDARAAMNLTGGGRP